MGGELKVWITSHRSFGLGWIIKNNDPLPNVEFIEGRIATSGLPISAVAGSINRVGIAH